MRIESDQIKTAAVVALLALVFVFALWMPTQGKKAALQQRINAAQRDAQDRSKDAKGMVQLVEQVNELEALAKGESHYVPDEGELADLLRRLTSELTRQSAQNLEIKTEVIQQHGRFNVMPVTLRFRGSFQSVFEFLERVETMRRLVRVTDVDVEMPVREMNAQALDVRVELSAFFKALEGEPRS